MPHFTLALFSLSGCIFGAGKGECPDGTLRIRGECVADSARPCATELAFTAPEDGATEVNAWSSVHFVFDSLDPSAVAWIDGVDARSLWDRHSRSLVLTPEEPLQPLTTYTGGVRWCHDEHETTLSFTTSALGTPVDPTQIPGRVWAIDLTSAEMVEPPGVGDVLITYIDDPVALLAATAADEQSVSLLMAPTTGDDLQDLCANTPSFSASLVDNPTVSFGPEDVELPYEDTTLSLLDTEASFVLGPDGSFLTEGTLSTTLDTRSLDPVLAPDEPAGATCSIFAGFGVECGPCPGDGDLYCVNLRYINIEATAHLVPLTPVLGECDPSCLTSDGECLPSECGCASGSRQRGFVAGVLGLLLGLLRRR